MSAYYSILRITAPDEKFHIAICADLEAEAALIKLADERGYAVVNIVPAEDSGEGIFEAETVADALKQPTTNIKGKMQNTLEVKQEKVQQVLDRVYQATRGIRVPILFEVCPRYCSGSPTLVSEQVCAQEALDEQESRERHLSGVYGEEHKAKAEKEGLEWICFARWTKGNKAWRYDLITGALIQEPKRLNSLEEDRLKLLRNWKEFGLSNWHTGLENELVALEGRARMHQQKIA